MAAYLRAVEACPGISANSDLAQRVIELGGVPLREDRDVDVKYVTREDNQPLRTTALATDGRRLFLGGVVLVKPSPPTNANATSGRRFYGGVGVAAFDPDFGTWQSLNTDLEVTCLKRRDRELWVGTNGVWASSYGRELTRWGADAQTNELFKPAWYFVPGTKAGYQLNFVTERGDEARLDRTGTDPIVFGTTDAMVRWLILVE